MRREQGKKTLLIVLALVLLAGLGLSLHAVRQGCSGAEPEVGTPTPTEALLPTDMPLPQKAPASPDLQGAPEDEVTAEPPAAEEGRTPVWGEPGEASPPVEPPAPQTAEENEGEPDSIS